MILYLFWCNIIANLLVAIDDDDDDLFLIFTKKNIDYFEGLWKAYGEVALFFRLRNVIWRERYPQNTQKMRKKVREKNIYIFTTVYFEDIILPWLQIIVIMKCM